jgi:ketol-acid reductoisomerase
MHRNPELVIIGFGNQARAWGMNLRDSGMPLTYALRKNSDSVNRAKKQNFPVIFLEDSESLKNYQYFALLIPDLDHPAVFSQYDFPYDAVFVLAHGYSFCYLNLPKKFQYLLLAPKAIASEMRFQYETQGKLGAVFSVENSLSPDLHQSYLFSLAKNLGITSGPFKAPLIAETQADLLSEQALLCGLIPYAALSCYNLLRRKGIPKEAAYFECWYELKLIVDAMVKIGPEDFFDLISPNALAGAQKGRELLVGNAFQAALEKIFTDIENGNFTKELAQMDIDSLKKRVRSFWQQEELAQTHRELKNDLF